MSGGPHAFPGIAASDPAAALAVAASRLGVRVDWDAVARRFDRHPLPQSLRALVEIAPELGIEARAFRSDVEGLAGASLPAIVHLVEAGSEEGGFGILLERAADRFVIDDASGAAPRSLTAREFEASWSGVVVTLKLHEGTAPSPALRRGGLGMRLRAWYRRGEPLARATSLAQGAGLTGLALVALWSALRFGLAVAGAIGAVAACAVVALSAVGVAVSATLFAQGRRSTVPAGPSRLAASICGRGTFTDCLGVLASRFSHFAGIDWGSVGAAFFSANILLIALGALVSEEQRRLLWAWLALAHLPAAVGSLWLIAIQVWLRRFCPLCMTVHGVVLISSALGLGYLVQGGWPASPAALLPWAAAHLLALLTTFGLVVPHLAHRLESRTYRARLGWIGATPLGALAEAAGRPRGATTFPEAPIRIGSPAAPFRLDALVHPMCSGCGPVVSKLAALAERHAARVTIGFHLPPRDSASRADREMCAALAVVGLVAGGEAAVATFLRVKEDPWSALRAAEAGGASPLVERLLPASGAASSEAIARGREAVAAADRLGEALERGTPTLLIQGRFWDGSVDDLERLLVAQPELLASVLRR